MYAIEKYVSLLCCRSIAAVDLGIGMGASSTIIAAALWLEATGWRHKFDTRAKQVDKSITLLLWPSRGLSRVVWCSRCLDRQPRTADIAHEWNIIACISYSIVVVDAVASANCCHRITSKADPYG